MLIGYLFGRVEDDDLRECLAFGLAGGLAFGLAFGLVVGLAGGLAVGLAGGLAGGLVGGLAVGLAFGLVVGLAFGLVVGLAEIYTVSIETFIIIIILILVVSEILFWFDKHKYSDIGRWGNTFLKKGESLFESSAVIVNIVNVFNHYQDVIVFFGEQQDAIKQVLSFVGYGTIIVLFMLGFIWFNSLKYREKKKDNGKKKP